MVKSLMENGSSPRRPVISRRSGPESTHPVRIGLALGGGFARGIAHTGVLQIFEEQKVPLHCIAGVSAGSIVASAFASGAAPDEIARIGASMRFADVARWGLNRMGFMSSNRMESFLKKLLRQYRFEDMRIPLSVVATDLSTGEPAIFSGHGDVFLPVRFYWVRRARWLKTHGAKRTESSPVTTTAAPQPAAV